MGEHTTEARGVGGSIPSPPIYPIEFGTKLLIYAILIAIFIGVLWIFLDWLNWKWTNKIKNVIGQFGDAALRSISGV